MQLYVSTDKNVVNSNNNHVRIIIWMPGVNHDHFGPDLPALDTFRILDYRVLASK